MAKFKPVDPKRHIAALTHISDANTLVRRALEELKGSLPARVTDRGVKITHLLHVLRTAIEDLPGDQ